MQIQQLPFPVRRDTLTPADTLEPGIVGRAAERIFADTLQNLPARLGEFGRGLINEMLLLLPQLIAATLAVVIILAAIFWTKRLMRRHASEDDRRRGSSLTVLGVLLAGLAAAAIMGATRTAAALATFTVYYLFATILRVFGTRMLGRWRTAPEAADLVLTGARYIILLFGLVEALGTFGLNVGGIIAGVGIIGIAIGFAAQDTLANIIAGFVILWDQPLHVGDWVQIGDSIEGRVRRMTLRTTRIDTLDHGVLVVPNREITGSRVYNYSLRKLWRQRVAIVVPYDTDLSSARAVMLRALPPSPIISGKPEPAVAVTELGRDGLALELVYFVTDPREAYPLRWQTNEALFRACSEAGITLSYSQIVVRGLGDRDSVRSPDAHSGPPA